MTSLAFADIDMQRHAILRRLKEQHTLLKIHAQTSEVRNKFSSTILTSSFDDGYLVLDDFFPTPKEGQIEPGTVLQVFGQYNGASFSFRTTITDVASQDNLLYYRVSYPETVSHHQKRNHYRVRIGNSRQMVVTVHNGHGAAFTGYVDDISASGLRIRFDMPEVLALKRDSLLRNCNIQLLNSDIHCALRVRDSLLGVSGKERYFVHCEYFDLTPTQQTRLEKEIATIQRESIRSQRRKMELKGTNVPQFSL